MTNYFNNLWTGALLHPARWRYTSERFEVSCGILLTLASFLFFFFKFAGICAVVTLIMWIFAVITPDRRYIISADGKRFFIALFRTGKKNARQRTDKSSRTALMRLSKFFNQQTKATECNVQKIFGYDDAYKSSGMFLFKTKPDDWTLISGKYPNTLFLGENLRDNLYIERKAISTVIVTLLHGDTAARFEVAKVDCFPHYTYDRKKAQYQPVASCKPQEPDFDACKKLALEYRGRKKLFLIGIGCGHIPMAFQIKVPYVYMANPRRGSSGPIPLSHDDWSFAQKNFYG